MYATRVWSEFKETPLSKAGFLFFDAINPPNETNINKPN